MRDTRDLVCRRIGLAVLFGALALGPALAGAQSAIERGKEIAFDRKKGNCLACHKMDDGESPGNIGPPLVGMKVRFPDKQALRAQIWDPTIRNPETIMMPYGRHKILSDEEIDLVVEYVQTL